MRQPHLAEILEELKRGLVGIYGDRLAHVILYGSQARGDADPESDIDVLIVRKGEVDHRAEQDRTIDLVCDLALEHEVLVSTFVVSQDDYRTKRYPFFINVRREGIAKTGQMSAEFHKYLIDAQRARLSSDYVPLSEFTVEDAERFIGYAKDFICPAEMCSPRCRAA